MAGLFIILSKNKKPVMQKNICTPKEPRFTYIQPHEEKLSFFIPMLASMKGAWLITTNTAARPLNPLMNLQSCLTSFSSILLLSKVEKSKNNKMIDKVIASVSRVNSVFIFIVGIQVFFKCHIVVQRKSHCDWLCLSSRLRVSKVVNVRTLDRIISLQAGNC